MFYIAHELTNLRKYYDIDIEITWAQLTIYLQHSL